jgi:GT2 family glycosyltransferase
MSWEELAIELLPNHEGQRMAEARIPSVYVVVLNWKNYPATRDCLLSLRSVTYPNLHTIVVDNHSEDGSIERLRAEFPECSFIENPDNLGFGRGCNPGMAEAVRRNCDYVLLLNNDVQVPPGFLEPAVAEAESDPRIGMVTGKVMFTDRPNVIWHAGGHIIPLRFSASARGWGETDRGQYDEVCDTRWATGAMCLVSRAVLDQVGFIPEEYFFGQEEWDYSTAVLRAGFRIRYVPEFRSFHDAGNSYTATHPVLIVYNGARNKMLYAYKYLPRGLFPLWRVAFWVYQQLMWPRLARKLARSEEDYRVLVRAGQMAFYDFNGGARVELADLKRTSERLGPTATWGDSWRPKGTGEGDGESLEADPSLDTTR